MMAGRSTQRSAASVCVNADPLEGRAAGIQCKLRGFFFYKDFACTLPLTLYEIASACPDDDVCV